MNRFSALLWILFAGCAPSAYQIGSKNFTEGIITGELITQTARDGGFEVSHKAELGGTRIVFDALKAGSIDVYADYTGTISEELLKDQGAKNDEELRSALAKQGIGMTARLGFNNNYAIGLKEEVAEKRNLKKISDLARADAQDLKLGFSEEFMNRVDGWNGLKAAYGLKFAPNVVDHNLAYPGLDSGAIQVTDLYSTDAEIEFYALRTLEDDRGYFPRYFCVVLYRLELEKTDPKFVESIKRLEGIITNDDILQMNASAKLDRRPATEVAADFLRRKLRILPNHAKESLLRDLVWNGLVHLRLVFESLLAAIVVALPLGVIAYRIPRVGHAILGCVGILQTIPSLAILVFLVPFLKLGPRPAIVALFIYSLLPIVRNTYQGLSGIAPQLRESAETLGLSSWSRLWLVELPLASPSILAGIKTAAVINVGTATIGALAGAGGFGRPILSGIRLASTNLILQGAVPAALMAIGVQSLFDWLELWVVPKGLRLKRTK